MPITREQRRRLQFIVVLLVTLMVTAAVGIGTNEGPLVGLTVVAVAAVFPAAFLAVVAYVWSTNDSEDAERGLPPLYSDRLP